VDKRGFQKKRFWRFFFGQYHYTGDIEISGSGNYYKVQNYPLALSVNGKIDFSGSGNVHGLLFAMNRNFEKTGNGNVTGSIICKGNFRKSGGWDFLTYEKSVPPARCFWQYLHSDQLA